MREGQPPRNHTRHSTISVAFCPHAEPLKEKERLPQTDPPRNLVFLVLDVPVILSCLRLDIVQNLEN